MVETLDRIGARPQTLRIMALERVRDAIMEGRIAPGERLVERTLAERLGVSRSVIREVIRNLESEGLVENTPAGPRLATISVSQAEQIYEVRMLLESSAAAACAKASTKDVVAQLHAALADIRQAHEELNPNRALRASTRFYAVMFVTGGQDIAWDIVQRLNSRISQLRAMTLSGVGRQEAGLKRLRQIVAAIADGDPAAASKACRDHVLEASQIAVAMLGGKP